MRSSSSGRVGGRLAGTEDESDAREKGQRGRTDDQGAGCRREPGRGPSRGPEQREAGGDLQRGLDLAVETCAQDLWRARAELHGDELAGEDQDDRPARRDPTQRQRDQRADNEDLVCERVKCGHERRRAAAPRTNTFTTAAVYTTTTIRVSSTVPPDDVCAVTRKDWGPAGM